MSDNTNKIILSVDRREQDRMMDVARTLNELGYRAGFASPIVSYVDGDEFDTIFAANLRDLNFVLQQILDDTSAQVFESPYQLRLF